MIIVGTSQTTVRKPPCCWSNSVGRREILWFIRSVIDSLFIAHVLPKIDPWTRQTTVNPAETPFSPSVRVGSLAATVLFVFLCCFYLAGRPVQVGSLPNFELINHSRTPPALRRVAEALAKCHRLKAMAGKCRRSSPVAVAVFQRETKTRAETNWSCTNSQSDDFAGPVSGSIRLNYQGKLTELVN